MIPTDIYSKIHELMPIICIDIVTVVGSNCILLNRNDKPAKGKFWLPGGRIKRNQSIEQAVVDILNRECGLTDIIKVIPLGYDETHFNEDPFDHGKGTHTVNLVFKAICRGNVAIDGTSNGFISVDFSKLNEFEPYVQKWIRKGFKCL